MASVRGFTLNDNRTYRSVGVRGFNLPWDYGSRILVMVNGHNMADHVFDSMLWFGDDFPIDMHLVKQIEIIRGPSSALYGSNGEFATINVITKAPEEAGPPSLTTEFGSFGEKKAQMMADCAGRQDAPNCCFPERYSTTAEKAPYTSPALDTPETNHGQAIEWMARKAITSSQTSPGATGRSRRLFPTARKSSRSPGVPPSSMTAERTWMKPRTTWKPPIRMSSPGAPCAGVPTTTRIVCAAVSIFRSVRRPTPAWLSRTIVRPSDSDWIGTQLTYRFDVARLGTLTAGAEAQIDVRDLPDRPGCIAGTR